ncbi:MAG: TM2 domain-containing protein [Lentisphaeria bacterium]|nr:TM2 domain-containing protein [Lentisphaeria bacterium]
MSEQIFVDPNAQPKSRVTYVILGLLLGGLGIHNFYSGHIGKGIAKIVLTAFGITAVISGIWALIEICTVKADAKGVPFK